MTTITNCDCCSNYVYDEDYECYVCETSLDEDEMVKFLTGTFSECPYFQYDNEYKIAQKQ